MLLSMSQFNKLIEYIDERIDYKVAEAMELADTWDRPKTPDYQKSVGALEHESLVTYDQLLELLVEDLSNEPF